MTVNTNLSRVQYNGNGVTTAFAFANRVTDSSQIKVTRTIISSGANTVLTLNDPSVDGYSVAGVPSSSVTVNTVAAPATGTRLTIQYNMPFTQTADYVANDPFPAETHEGALDKLTIICQQQQDAINRSLKFPDTSDTSLVAQLPLVPVDGAALIWSGVAGQVANGPNTTDISNAASYAAQTSADVITTGNNVTAAAISAASAAASAAGMKYRATRAASIANVASLSGTTTIDGVSLIAGDRVLLKNQATTSANGIYVIAAGAWSRSTDMDAWIEVPGTVVVVTEGTVNGDKVFLCTSNDGGTLGSTAITFIDWAAVIFDQSITAAKLIDSVINDLTTATIASNDYVAIADVSASGVKKKALVSDIVALFSPTVATQSTMEAAANLTDIVTAGRQQYHPGMPKAWVKFDGSTGTVSASYNVSSVTRNSTGNYTVNFTTAFSSSNYGASVTSDARVSGAFGGYFGQMGTQAAGSCVIYTCNTNVSGTQVVADADRVYAVFFGDQ